MIQSLRENLSGGVAIVLVTLIAIPLAFFGVESIFLNSTRVNEVATVNGEDITELELERAVVNQMNQLLAYIGSSDPSLIDESLVRPAALEQLIEQKTLLSKAKKGNLGVSDQFLATQIRTMEAFQVGGQFNEAAFSSFLVNYGYTVTTFMEALTEESVANLMLSGIRASSFSTQEDLERRIALVNETRSYQYFTIPQSDIIASVEIPHEEVEAYYSFYQEDYREPEKVVIDYISLSPSVFLEETINYPNLSDLVVERFDLLKQQQGDQKRVAHILFEETETKSVSDQVEEVQLRLQAGEVFADLAAEYSADIGSANFGGDLGFTQGATFPDAFEAAVADLDAGEISPAVETDAGTHIILVSDVTETNFELETQYASIELEIRNELAQEEYLDAVDELTGLAFSTDNLEQLLEAFSEGEKLEILSTEPFTETSGNGIATSAQVRSVAFSENVLRSDYNEVVQISESESVVIHLKEYLESAIPLIEAVEEQIITQLQTEEATDLLIDIAQNLETEIRNGATLDSVAGREGYEWQAAIDSPRVTGGEVGNLIFSALLDGGFPIVGGGQTANGDYHVYRITEARAGELIDQTDEQLLQAREQVALERSEMEWLAYTASLEANASIDRKVDYSVLNEDL